MHHIHTCTMVRLTCNLKIATSNLALPEALVVVLILLPKKVQDRVHDFLAVESLFLVSIFGS